MGTFKSCAFYFDPGTMLTLIYAGGLLSLEAQPRHEALLLKPGRWAVVPDDVDEAGDISFEPC